MLYNVVLVSTVQQGESAVHVPIACLLKFLSHLGHHRALSRVPYAIQYVLLVIYFIYSGASNNSKKKNFLAMPHSMWNLRSLTRD